MADDKNKRDDRDRAKVSGSDEDEVVDFAQQHGLTAQQARDLMEQHRNDREKLARAAGELKGAQG